LIRRFLGGHRGLIYVTVGNLLGAAITGGFWLLLATLQTPEEYGTTNYSIAIASFSSFVVLLGLNTVVTTYLAKGSTKVNIEMNQLVFISSIVVAVVISVLHDWMLGLIVIGMAFWMMSLYEALGKRLYKQYALINIGARASQLALSLILFFMIGVPGVIIGFLISYFLFSYRYFRTIRCFNFRHFSELKGLMKFALHSYSFNMSNAFFMYFDKLIIVPLFGVAVLGFYQFGFQFLMFLGMIPVSFYQYLLPEQSSLSSSAAGPAVKTTKVHIFGFLVSVALAGLLFMLSPWIVDHFFPKFVEAVGVLRILSIGIVPMMVVWNLNSRFVALNHTRSVVIGSAIYLIVQISLMLELGYSMGAPGIAIATVLALASQAVFLFLSSRYLVPKIIAE
jgi:O-antigen/teichoic acid export membrane protein